MRQHYLDIIDKLGLRTELASFEPTVIGTPPLNIDIETSDIDIACTAENLTHFVSSVSLIYDNQTDFVSEYFQTREKAAARCNFTFAGWEIELFCQKIPITEQWGVRHFKVEERLLQLDARLRAAVIQLKQSGLKTEAAFARILGLNGDPFEAILMLEDFSKEELRDLILQNNPENGFR